jgi:hypothetical protein
MGILLGCCNRLWRSMFSYKQISHMDAQEPALTDPDLESTCLSGFKNAEDDRSDDGIDMKLKDVSFQEG